MSNHNGAMRQDLENLRLLSVFHYVLGGITAVFSCLPIIHLLLGIAIVTGQLEPSAADFSDPDFSTSDFRAFGWIFIIFALFFIILGWLFAASLVVAGWCLSHRKKHTLCLVVAAFSCMFVPFGTALGVFTLITLTKESVKSLFQTDRRSLSS